MEDLFKNIKPLPYPVKGGYGRLGYGVFLSRRSRFGRVNKRKRNRYIRKYGFDISETWSLDYTTACWMSDNVGGYFRKCGQMDHWYDFDLEGNTYTPDSDCSVFIAAENARKNDYLKHLDDFIKSGDSGVVKRFIAFIVPRLSYLAKNTHGYPPYFETIDKWRGVLLKMAEDFKVNSYSKDFTENFFLLWD